MLTRRSLLTSLVIAAVAPKLAHADNERYAGLTEGDFTPLAARSFVQHKPQWCWAASISAIFGYYGHLLEQEEIVRACFGNLDDRPASEYTITDGLSRAWRDGQGRLFHANVKVWAFNEHAITNEDVINEMSARRPMLVAAHTSHNPIGHAMVLLGVTYVRSFIGYNIVAARVADPAPEQACVRSLAVNEMTPYYLAAVRIN